ncbi:MAG TPA: site-2 protease family protein [Micromonosporaceae bacterium]|nr:site-2 protease family protein [Micromonosporaceae bacterium]
MDPHIAPVAAAARPAEPTSAGSGIPLGRLLGFPVRLSPTWLVLAALVTFTYGQTFGRTRPELPATVAYAIGFGFVLCLVASVLLHELGHALVSRRFGIGVRGITLEMLGGYTEMEREAPRPVVELTVSLAGPLVSLAIGLLSGVAAAALPGGTVARELAFQVAVSNVIVAVFNALPGLPLDGGRAVQAVIWAATGDPHRARRIAAHAGRGLAVICIAGAAFLYAQGFFSFLGVVFLLLVAASIWTGAGHALRAGRMGGQLRDLDLSGLVRPIVAVAGSTPLEQALRYAAAAPATAGGAAVIAVADGGGQVTALLNDAAAGAVPVPRRSGIAVEALSRRIDADHVVAAHLRGADLLRAVAADPQGDYLVVEDEDVVGVLRGADLAQMLLSGLRRTPTARRMSR